MRNLIVISFLTLDGVMQAPGGAEEDTSGGFQYGGWQMPFFSDMDDPASENPVITAMDRAGALLLGRKTYDIFAGYWPTTGKDIEPYGPFMNSIPKYVASRTLEKTAWQNSTLLQGDAPAAVAALKREAGKDIYMFGSGNFIQTLMRENLVDMYSLMIHPLALGQGKRLFNPDGPRQDMALVKSATSGCGVLLLTYQVKAAAG